MSGYLWLYAILGVANFVYFVADGWWANLVGLAICVFGFCKTLADER